MVQVKTVYITEDGKEFDSSDEASRYEETIRNDKMEKYRRYINDSYGGRQLLNKYPLDEYGVWEVRGEDENPDLGGYHHEPFIGVFEGKLKDVIMEAVAHPNFWSWGSGGSIYKKNIVKVGSTS